MARYIDVDKLIFELNNIAIWQGRDNGMDTAIKTVHAQPIAAAVEKPCTCSECKHFKIINFMTGKNEPALAECQKQGITFLLLVADPKKHFCSDGERK